MTTDQLKLIDCGEPSESPGEHLAKFNEFNKWYPHNPARRNKAKALSVFLKITGGGTVVTKSFHKDSNTYVEIYHVDVTADQLVEAAKAKRKALIPQAAGEYSPDTRFQPFADVWLNSGQYQDYIDD